MAVAYRIVLAVLLSFFVLESTLAETIQNESYRFVLSENWAVDDASKYAQVSTKPEHLLFDGGKAKATISAAAFSERDALEFADTFLELRLRAEGDLVEETGRLPEIDMIGWY